MDCLAEITLAGIDTAAILLTCANCAFWRSVALDGHEIRIGCMVLGDDANMVGNSSAIPVEEDDVSRLGSLWINELILLLEIVHRIWAVDESCWSLGGNQ